MLFLIALCFYRKKQVLSATLENGCVLIEYTSYNPVIDEGTNRMPTVKLKDNEPFDVALRRFKRSCEKAGVLADIRSREFYEKPTAERKRKAAAAVKRHAKKVQREQRRHERLY